MRPRVVAKWLNLLQIDLGWPDCNWGHQLFRESLHAVRDFLTVDEAADLSAQLSVLIRGIFFEGWIPAKAPVTQRSVDDFLNRTMLAFSDDPLVEPDAAVAAVLWLLRRQISVGEYRAGSFGHAQAPAHLRI
jgi:uncharacterized protein (DUF2267 family)